MTKFSADDRSVAMDRSIESATKWTATCLERIAENDAMYHAVSQVFEQDARQHAAHLDDQKTQGSTGGPLHGIPYLVKELIDIEGIKTSFGSDSYAFYPAERSAPVIDRLKAAGANLLGTTHMVEFAFGSWGSNYQKGTPWNPCDTTLHRAPGGSSSGSAVAVAAGYVPVAIGSDTGGSIRIPASLCGVIGFKPSYGLIPTEGVAPLGPTFDTLGTLSRTIDDARRFTEVMSGDDLSHPPVDIKGLRVAVLSREALLPIESEIEKEFWRTVNTLERHGAIVTQIDLPLTLVEFQKLNGEIVGFEAFEHLKHLVEDWRRPMDPHVRSRVLANRKIDRATYETRLAQLERVRAEFTDLFANFDVMALPGTPISAPPMAQVDESQIPMSRYTRVANCLDLCAITLPQPRAEGEMPCGFQLCASAHSDNLLLATAESVFALSYVPLVGQDLA